MPRFAIRDIEHSLGYDGTAYVDFANNAFNGEEVGTIETWFRIQEPSQADTTSFFCAAGQTTAGRTFNWQTTAVSGKAYLRVGTQAASGSDFMRGSTALELNKWHHGVVTTDGSTWKMYLNGSLETLVLVAGSNSGNWFADIDVDAVTIYSLGVRHDTTGDATFLTGKLTTTRLWDNELTAAQISDLYYNNVAPPTGLLGEWLHTDGTGATLTDTSGNGNNGTITSSVWSGDTPFKKRLVTRSTPYSLDYNGSTTYTDLPDDIYNTDSTGAIEMWIFPTSRGTNDVLFGIADSADSNELIDFTMLDNGNESALRFLHLNGGTNNAVHAPNDSIKYNAWNHVIAQTDGSAWSIYINGKVQVLTVSSGSNTGVWLDDITWTTAQYSFGVLHRQTGDVGFFPGSMAVSRYYNAVLTATEIEDLYYDNKVPTAKLVDEWLHTEGTGATVASTGSGGNDGTITGATWDPDNTPF